ncbi:hypothetical protein [Rhodococcus marinonascens]|uniref:hypothetical protein n=1 Tax=Rhodococcus marinonascens TaxID=38311 RepID=UPI000B1AE7CE|nr:hypothetical protein [Rhodococcus marinonascens]
MAEQHQLIESLRTRNTDLGEENTQIRGEADRAAAAATATATATATITLLESDLDQARAAIEPERARGDHIRDELTGATAELATPHAHTEAARERVEELRTDLAEARNRTTRPAGRRPKGGVE